MKHLFTMLFAFSLTAATNTDLEKITVTKDYIHLISSFEQVDYFSTLNLSGEFQWEIPFGSKIQSVKLVEDDKIMILSKHRNDLAYFASMVDQKTGKVVWEKTIFSPSVKPADETEETQED